MTTSAAHESALIRSIRLRRPEDALYHFAILRESGYRADRLARRLFVSACRDNLDLGILERAVMFLQEPESVEKLPFLADLASSEKLWSVHSGRQLVRLISHAVRDGGLREFTDAEVALRFEAALGHPDRFVRVMYCLAEILARHRMFPGSWLGKAVGLMMVRAQGTPAAFLGTVYDKFKAVFEANPLAEDTLVYLLATWAETGIWGQGVDTSARAFAIVGAARRAKAEPQVPAWAATKDRRFDASWPAYENMVKMFEEYGRLDPGDEGVLVKTKDGVWKPIIREEEGIYIVQSEEDPYKTYEVSLASMMCSCPDHQRRGDVCKHQVHARKYAESTLPFEVG